MRGPSLAPAETDPFKIVAVIRWLLARLTMGREVLTAARTYYVATSGSDTNDGLSSTNAFATIQKALNTALGVDGQTFNITISVAAGTYNENLTVGAPFLTSAAVALTGDTATPSNVVINGGLTVSNGGKLALGGFKITSSSFGLQVNSGAIVTINAKMEWGACTTAHMYSTTFGGISLLASYTVTGDAVFHMLASFYGSITVSSGGTASQPSVVGTMGGSGTRAFAYTVYSSTIAQIYISGLAFSGPATGKRFNVDSIASINTGGGGENYIPGNAAGTVGNLGLYQ
jgi:uncharacterized protein DUF1565